MISPLHTQAWSLDAPRTLAAGVLVLLAAVAHSTPTANQQPALPEEQATAAPPAGAAPVRPSTLPGLQGARLQALEVVLNSNPVGTWEVLEYQGGYWVDRTALQAWRVLMPAAAQPLMHAARLWWPLFAVPGYRAGFDEAQQLLSVEVLAAAFEPSVVGSAAPQPMKASPPIHALFLNYDVSWTETRGGTAGQSDRGLLTEAGWSSGHGVLLSTQVARWVSGGGTPDVSLSRRLETYWTRDWPEHRLTLRMGDGWTRASAWGRQAAFGGLQLGSTRALWPPGTGLANPVLTGSALTPSTVELYVNDVLRQSVQVPAGPFALNNSAPLSGAGEARLVVRDLLGRETVVARPFFTSPLLLAPGHQEWSMEAGRLRRGFGLQSTDEGYGHAVAQAWLKRGLTPNLTLETRLQAGSGLAQWGAAATASVLDRALLETALAVSRLDGQQGTSALIGMQSQGRRHALSLRAVASSRDFAEAGRTALDRPSQLETSIAWRMGLSGGHALGTTVAAVHRHDGSAVTTAALSYTQHLPNWGHLVWTASRITSTRATDNTTNSTPTGTNQGLQVLLVMPLDARAGGIKPVATAQLLRQRSPEGRVQTDAVATVNAPAMADNSWGWRAVAGQRSGQALAEAGVHRQASQALVGLEVSAIEGVAHAVRGYAQGAFMFTEGRLFSTRRIQESFALVEVPGHADVGVALDGLALTRTNAQGLALLPRLVAHQHNRVRLNANDVPVDAEIDTLELGAVPAWRSGVKLHFPVREGRGALLSFLVAGGEPAPRGAVLTLEGESREFTVGHRGQVYVTGLPPHTARRATLSWQGARCAVDIHWQQASPQSGPQPSLRRLGPWQCPEITP